VDPYGAITTAVRQYPALRAVMRRISEAGVLAPGANGESQGDDAAGGLVPVASRPDGGPGIELVDLAVAWPGGGNVFTGLTAAAQPGRWLAVTGVSGSGKSTLLAAILGFLPAASGHLYLSGRAAWCPQEAHLFDSTIRGNLLLARPEPEPAGTDSAALAAGDAPRAGKAVATGGDAQMRAALDAVGLGPLLALLEDGLDTRIGPGGAFLSGGERTRLAVARTLMTGADVILLDEPTAHLDAESGRLMLAELRDGLRDRTIVLVTHNPNDIDAADTRLDLDAAAVAAAAGEGPAPAAVLARG
jgi:ATP-binding cassette subfamily C protein CydCD